MKLNGTHKSKASSAQVFNAILNPAILKASIPGCSLAEFISPNQIKVEITTPLPGLRGPFQIVLNVINQQAPNFLQIQVLRQGKGGSVNANAQIQIADDAGGSLLSYEANAELEGAISVVDNPIGRPVVNNGLNNFFKNLDKELEKTTV
jgi:carbon monoxide dehydrogenase subunit G